MSAGLAGLAKAILAYDDEFMTVLVNGRSVEQEKADYAWAAIIKQATLLDEDALAAALATPSPQAPTPTIEDGFGGVWSKRCPECQQLTMDVVRPGKVQCWANHKPLTQTDEYCSHCDQSMHLAHGENFFESKPFQRVHRWECGNDKCPGAVPAATQEQPAGSEGTSAHDSFAKGFAKALDRVHYHFHDFEKGEDACKPLHAAIKKAEAEYGSSAPVPLKYRPRVTDVL